MGIGLLGGEVGESLAGGERARGKLPSSAHLSPRSCEDSYKQWALLCWWYHKRPGGGTEVLLALSSGMF